MTDNVTFRSFGSVLDDIMSKLQEPEQDEASERILRKLDAEIEHEKEQKARVVRAVLTGNIE